MKSRSIKLVILLILSSLVLLFAACRGQTAGNQTQTVNVRRGDIVLKVSADGSLSLVQDRKLTFGTTGTIAEVKIKEGDRVTKGQVLARLDTADIERAVNTAELAVKAAEVDLSQAQSGIKSVQADARQAADNIKNAEIDLETVNNAYYKLIVPNPYITYKFRIPESTDAIRIAEARINDAQAELQKILDGREYSVVDIENILKQAQDSLLNAENQLAWGIDEGTRPANADYWTLRNLQLQIDKAELALDNAKNVAGKAALALDNANNTVSKAQIAVENARNNLLTARNTLAKATMAAPFDGVIGLVNIKEGDQWTAAGLTATAIELIEPSRMELTVKVDEIDIPNIAVGQKAIISMDALPDAKFSGTVSSVGSLPDVEAGVVSYKVKVSLNVPDGTPLKSGMSVTADIVQAEHKNVLLLPNSVIRQDDQRKSFVEVLENGQIQTRALVLGLNDGFQTEIVSGLTGGEAVVESPAKTGSPVSIFGGQG